MAKVQVEQGWLEGELLKLVTGVGDYYSFKGVPYAAPPVGKLRFKAPQPPLPWEGVRLANVHGSVCPQVDIFSGERIDGSEDCLFLNVYTKELKPKKPLAVMVFIHGGAFKSGSGNEDYYGPDFLVNHDVVLVTINYRLDMLGFLCLDTADVPGNAGLKDQVAALRWVQKNIANFGGDPQNVTIFGESAGGSSTALHVLSPMSKGLFKRAVPMSGVPLCDWSLPFQPHRRAVAVGKILGIETQDPKELLDYLQSLPVDKVVNTNPSIMAFEEKAFNTQKMFYFSPAVEKDFGQEAFLTEDPLVALKKGHFNDVDVLIGYTDQEGLISVGNFEPVLAQYSRFPETLVPWKILMNSTPIKILELSDKIRKHFFGDKKIDVNAMKEAVTYINETSFVYDVPRYIKLLAKSGTSKKFFYRFCCVSERNFFGAAGVPFGIIGASHFDDLMYLFDAKKLNIPMSKNGKGYKMVQMNCTLFTNFAKYGTPTPDKSFGLVWPEFGKEENYVDIADTLTAGTKLGEDSCKFWKSIYDSAGIEL